MTTRIKCRLCDTMILPVTAKFNDGLCGQCNHSEHRRIFDETVQSWIDNPHTLPGTNGIPEPEDFALSLRAKQIKELLSGKKSKETICHEFFDEAFDKWEKDGPKALTEKEKHILSVETFYGEVTNGGIAQYLTNGSCAFANWAPEGFDKIGIPEYSEVMRTVKALFPNSTIPNNYEDSWEVMKNFDDDLLDKIEEAFWERWTLDKEEIRRKLHAYIVEY